MAKKEQQDDNKMIHAMGKWNGYSHNKDKTVFQLAPMHIDRIQVFFATLSSWNELVEANNAAMLKLAENRGKLKNQIRKYITDDLGLPDDTHFSFSAEGIVRIITKEEEEDLKKKS